MIVDVPPVESAEGHVAEMYRGDLETDGFVYSHTQAMAVNPEAHAAFEALIRAIVPSIGLHTYEVATLAAAGAIGSEHCLLAHGRRSLDTGVLDEEEVIAVASGADQPLTDADAAVMRYCTRLSRDAAAMTDDDAEALRAAGFSDRQIVDITLAAAARNYFSRALQALAVPVEDVPRVSPRLRDALVGEA